jgi:ribosomal protein S27AE
MALFAGVGYNEEMTETIKISRDRCPRCGKDTDGMTVAAIKGVVLNEPVCLLCGTALAVEIVKGRPDYDPKKPVQVNLHVGMGP